MALFAGTASGLGVAASSAGVDVSTFSAGRRRGEG